jgi:hypothetical protein
VGHEIAHLHLAGQREHIAAFLVGDGGLVLGKSAGDLFKRQAAVKLTSPPENAARLKLTAPPETRR